MPLQGQVYNNFLLIRKDMGIGYKPGEKSWTITFNSCKTCRLRFLHMGLAKLWKYIHGNLAITLPIEIWLLLLRNNIPELIYSRKKYFS